MTNFKQDIQNHNVERALRLLEVEVNGGEVQVDSKLSNIPSKFTKNILAIISFDYKYKKL